MSIKDNFPSVGPSLSLNFARSKTLDPRITFSRSSVGTYMDGNGLIVTGSADEPRFDHKYENGVVKSLGLLVEEQRTNLYVNNNNPASGTSGTATKSTVQIVLPSGETGPALETDADAFAENYRNLTASSNTAPGYLTFYAKKKSAGSTGTLTITMEGGGTARSFNSASINSDTWTKISTTHDWSSSNSTLRRFDIYFNGSGNTSDGDTSFYTAFFQFEEGSFPTSYIPTSGSTKTRSADSVSIEGTNFTDVYNQTEGSYKVEGFIDGTLPSNTYGGIFGAGGGSATSNFIFLNPSNSFGQYVCNTSQTPNSTLGKTYTNGAKFKIAASYLEADFACSFNGDISNSSTSGALYGSMTYFKIGGNPISSVIRGAMRISNISYYPKQITDTQLQNLTK